MQETIYDQFVSEMEKIGLTKEFSILEEKDVTLSIDDEAIYITIPLTGINSYRVISIKGIREASIGGKIATHPYHIYMKIYGYDGDEMKPEDVVQISITEFKKGLPTVSETKSHIIYYNYPYSIASKRIRLKKGIVITKDRRLEIRVIKNGKPIKIGKIGNIRIECDKWFKKEDGKKNEVHTVDVPA